MGLIITAALWIGGGAALALIGLWIARWRVSHHTLRAHNDVAGFVYATVAVTYAVLLGFVTIAVWEEFQAARVNADGEANSVADLLRLSAMLPETERQMVVPALQAYARSVVDEEWKTMRDGGSASPQTEQAIDLLWEHYSSIDTTDDRQVTAVDQSLTRLQDLGNARRLRLLESQHGIPVVMWFVLLGGGVVTVAFAYGFGVERRDWHAAMLVTLSTTISMSLFLIYTLNNAFHGNVQVRPDGMELVLRQFS